MGKQMKAKGRKWTPDEDEKLKQHVNTRKGQTWERIAQALGIGKSASSCRQRWTDHLSPDVNDGPITEDEGNKTMMLYSLLGKKWSRIARELPTRSGNAVKNFCNKHLAKQKKQAKAFPPVANQQFSLIGDNTAFNNWIDFSSAADASNWPPFNNCINYVPKADPDPTTQVVANQQFSLIGDNTDWIDFSSAADASAWSFDNWVAFSSAADASNWPPLNNCINYVPKADPDPTAHAIANQQFSLIGDNTHWIDFSSAADASAWSSDNWDDFFSAADASNWPPFNNCINYVPKADHVYGAATLYMSPDGSAGGSCVTFECDNNGSCGAGPSV